MSIECSKIVKYMEEIAPKHLAEDWDNIGLMVGSTRQNITKVLVCVDVTSKIVDEAVDKGVDLIISHHPLIFKPLKRINEEDFKGRIIYKLIRNNLSVYSAHTNLDFVEGGINDRLASLLGLTNIKNLRKYKDIKFYKIVVFVPEESIDTVRNAMSEAGAGWIGNYSDCSFMTKGTGTFRPLEGTNPYIGKLDNLEYVTEYRLETIISGEKLHYVLDSMIKAHPYEEVAYDVYPLERNDKAYGAGKIGTLAQPQTLDVFIQHVKKALDIKDLQLIGHTNKPIEKVAVFCGGFDGDWSGVLREGADILITGDIKYNTAVDIVEMGLCVIDAGHFNTERVIIPQLVSQLSRKFPELEVVSHSLENDPIKFC